MHWLTVGMSRSYVVLPSKDHPCLAAGNCVRRVLVWMMGDVIDGMMGYVPLRVIMDKILAKHGNHPFGDFRATILNMLSAYGYERAILVCLAPLTSCIDFRYLGYSLFCVT